MPQGAMLIGFALKGGVRASYVERDRGQLLLWNDK